LSDLARFLEKLLSLLEASGIPYMVTGSLGSVFHGEPRSSRDVDVVIDPSREQLETFVQGAKPQFYVSAAEARDAFERRSLFNVVDLETGWKADLVVRKDRPFSKEEFARRRSVGLHGRTLDIVSPEDSILAKLEWAKESGSEVQRRDALGVAIAQRGQLDYSYLRHWATELGLVETLDELLRAAEEAR